MNDIQHVVEADGNGHNIVMPYKTENMVFDANNIKNFLDVPNRRLIRPAQVQSILEDLIKGEFHAPAMVLETLPKGKFYILDGGHRGDSFGQYFDLYPKTTITVPCHIYPKLTDEERRHIYNRYNIPIRQTRDDMIHTYKDTIPIYEELISLVPCTIYGKEKEHMKLSHVTSCYIAASDEGEFSGGYSAKPQDFVERLQALTEEDMSNIADFWSIMKDAFKIKHGEPLNGVSVLKTTPFAVLFRLWYQNKDRIPRDKMVERFSELRHKQLQGKPLLDEWARRTGRAMTRQCLMDVRSKINRGQPKELRFQDNF